MQIKYRKTIDGNLVLEIQDKDLRELEKLAAHFRSQGANPSILPLVDCEGTWTVAVDAK